MSSIEKAVNGLDNRFSRRNVAISTLPLPRLVSAEQAADPVSPPEAHSPLAANPTLASRPPVAARPPLALPVARFEKVGIICPDRPKSLVSEEYRSIKRPLLNFIGRQERSLEQPANVIMVSSCVAGEGKTFSAINLALSMAMERSQEVLFVDCDIAKASASEVFGLAQDTRGLLDLLQEESPDLESALIQTDLENLCILPAGVASDHGSELLGSEAMSKLVHQLAERHEDQVVIMDSAPLLVTNEANVIAELVGQVLFVVAAESTSHDMVSDALARLQGVPNVGLLLNKVKKSTGSGQGYGYGYGYQSSERRPSKRGKR